MKSTTKKKNNVNVYKNKNVTKKNKKPNQKKHNVLNNKNKNKYSKTKKNIKNKKNVSKRKLLTKTMNNKTNKKNKKENKNKRFTKKKKMYRGGGVAEMRSIFENTTKKNYIPNRIGKRFNTTHYIQQLNLQGTSNSTNTNKQPLELNLERNHNSKYYKNKPTPSSALYKKSGFTRAGTTSVKKKKKYHEAMRKTYQNHVTLNSDNIDSISILPKLQELIEENLVKKKKKKMKDR